MGARRHANALAWQAVACTFSGQTSLDFLGEWAFAGRMRRRFDPGRQATPRQALACIFSGSGRLRPDVKTNCPPKR
jgi:hypothetical protein